MKYLTGKNIEIDYSLGLGLGLAITIGKFDGLHRGHMALIAKLKEVAKKSKLATAMLTFTPHPATVLSGKDIPLILSGHEKIDLLKREGLDYYIEYPFTHQFAQISPECFIRDIAFQQLHARALIVGENFRFGKDGRGDVVLAKELGADLGLDVHITSLVTNNSAQINSENIRKLVVSKDFDGVAQACGRHFFLVGEVVCGKKKGREMGFPTANIVPVANKLLPPIGVYITITHVDDVSGLSITNVGPDLVETHILHYCGNLYGRTLRIDFHQWLRDMRNFRSPGELVQQLKNDAGDARDFFMNYL